METRRKVILVTTDPQLAPAVGAALGMNSVFEEQGVCRDLAGVAARLEQHLASAVLVDIDPQPGQILTSLDALSRRFGEVCFIVLSARVEGELVLAAMRAGARQFVPKGSIGSELPPALERFAPAEAALPETRGAAITVLSASGGCGATTIAVNLANELHLATSQRALIVDMDADYGAVGAYLGLQGQYGLADVLGHRARIDPELIRSTALAYSEGLHALLSPVVAGLSQLPPLANDRIGQAIEACRAAYAYTVIDAPRILLDTAVKLAHASLFSLIVFQLGVKDVRIARAMHAALSEGGVASGRLILVVNRHRSKYAMVSLGDARRAFGGFTPVCVQNDFRAAIESINYGKPLSETARRSAARRDISKMAEKIVEANAGDALAPVSR